MDEPTKPSHATHDLPVTTFVNPDELKKDIAIDLTDLNKCMQEQTAMYSYYAGQAARARRQYERDKNRLEVLEAVLNRKHRAALLEDNPKTTEAQVKSAVVTDSIWRNASTRLIDAQFELDLAKSAERSFDQRKDMLLQLARDANREVNSHMRVSGSAGLEAAKERFLAKVA